MNYTQRLKLPSALTAAAAITGMVAGLAMGTSWGEENVRRELRDLAAVPQSFEVDPLRGLTRAEMLLAVEEASSALEDGRPWAAWTALRPHVAGDAGGAPRSVVLLAARAAAGWNGWDEVRRLLRGRDWLASTGDRDGFLLLGRAEEAGGNFPRAADAYRRYAASADGPERGVALARLGSVLLRAGNTTEAARAFERAAAEPGEVADWYRALAAEAGLVGASSVAAAGASAPARARQARAEARALAHGGDVAAAAARLDAEARAVAADDPTTAAELDVARATILQPTGRASEAREALRRAAADERVESAARVSAAAALGRVVDGRTADEELARAAAYEAAGKHGLAAKALRAALRAGAPDDAGARLRLGRLLFDAGDLGPARVALTEAAAGLDPERASEAELMAARALLRSGPRAAGIAALKRVAERFPGTAASAGAWFHLGKVSSTAELAISNYRRAASVRVGPAARDALYRAGERALKNRDPASSAAYWEEYAASYPTSQETARAAYSAAVYHDDAGRDDRAAGLYRAAMAADPVSYYAVRAADRLGADVLAAALRDPRPWEGLASDPAEAAVALRRLDALERAGLEGPWKEELEGQARRLERRQTALLMLAEGVRDRNHTVEGIRIGRRLLEQRGGQWDARLLRVVFPFPFRELAVEEAKRARVDPFLLAGLIRQESSWDAEARSRVGATGLGQIMPATGKILARSAGVGEFRTGHLTVPEINLRMSATFLRDQLRHYDGARDLSLAAYNAGARPVDRWRRELGYRRDSEAFRERIPYAETREYVKVVLRNAEVYRRLYGSRGAGLVSR